MKSALLPLSALLFLSACGGGNSDDGKITETRMDDLDSVEGTISDEPVNMDASTDEAPIDASAPAAPKGKAKPETKDAAVAPPQIDPKTIEPAREPAKASPEAAKKEN